MKVILRSWFLFLAFVLPPAVARAQYQWDIPTNKVVLLAVNAHPDDEGIFFGGTLPYYSAALNLPTLLLSMTSGDWYPTNLPIREAELRCAASKYGLRYEPLFPRLRDVPSQNISGNPYTNKIDATWDYWADGVLQGDGADVEAGKLKAIRYVAEQIRRYRPDVIITHDVKGEYGHHNHMATAYVVTNAFFMAADPTVSSADLADLPPWQAKKLYLHLYPTNRLFHAYTELVLPELSNRTCRELADDGLNCHVSQRAPDVSTVYRTGENYDAYPSEWWGLYASTVGPDTPVASDRNIGGYVVPAGASVGSFLEHLEITNAPAAPAFVSDQIVLPPCAVGQVWSWAAPWSLVTDPNLAWGDTLTFEKLSGPEWLNVSSSGVFSGTPGSGNLGTNTFALKVTDSTGRQDQALLLIPVTMQFPLVPNLVGWWKLDDLAGGICPDSALPDQNGNSVGGVFAAQDGATVATASCIGFNGINGKIDVPYSQELNPPIFTAAVWANVQGGVGTYRSPLTSRVAVPMSGYVFYAGQNNNWQFWLGAGSAWKTLTVGPVKTNTWVHLAATYDGTTARFYTNGVLAASAASTFQPNGTYPLRIGAGGTEGSGQYWFNGFVDDVRIYDAALSPTHIASLYSNTAPKFIRSPAAVSAFAGTPFTGSFAADCADDGDLLSFGKLSGPTWIKVDSVGGLSGTPASADVGPNNFKVAVADSHGATATASIDIYVLPGRVPELSATIAGDSDSLGLNLRGVSGQTYVIEACDTLSTSQWAPVATNSSGASLFDWSDPEYPQRPRRFYRVAIP